MNRYWLSFSTGPEPDDFKGVVVTRAESPTAAMAKVKHSEIGAKLKAAGMNDGEVVIFEIPEGKEVNFPDDVLLTVEELKARGCQPRNYVRADGGIVIKPIRPKPFRGPGM